MDQTAKVNREKERNKYGKRKSEKVLKVNRKIERKIEQTQERKGIKKEKNRTKDRINEWE